MRDVAIGSPSCSASAHAHRPLSTLEIIIKPSGLFIHPRHVCGQWSLNTLGRLEASTDARVPFRILCISVYGLIQPAIAGQGALQTADSLTGSCIAAPWLLYLG